MCLYEEQCLNYVFGLIGIEREKGHFSLQGDSTVPKTVVQLSGREGQWVWLISQDFAGSKSLPPVKDRQGTTARTFAELDTQRNEEQALRESGDVVKGEWGLESQTTGMQKGEDELNH